MSSPTDNTHSADHLTAGEARRTARNVSALMVASILSKGILFGWQMLLAGLLGTHDFGIYNTVIALMAVGGTIANFGIGPVAIREVASHPKKADSYAASMLLTQTLLALVAYLLVLALGIAFGYPGNILAYAAIAALSLLIDIFGSIANDLLLARERMVMTSIVEISHIIVRVLLASLALWAGWGLLGVYLATIATGVLRSGVLWTLQWREGLQPRWPIDRGLTWRLLVNSAPLAATALLFQLYQNIDKLMTTSIIGAEGTGYLGLAFMINFGVIELLSSQVLMAVFPLMSRYHASNTPDVFGYLSETLFRFMLIAGLPVALVLSIFADDIILLLFSDEYAAAAGILQILIWYTLLAMLGNVLTRSLLVQNKQNQTFLVRAGSLGLNIALNLFLLTQFRDPRGAALASVAAEALALVLLMRLFDAPGFQWRQVGNSTLRTLALGLITAAVMVLVGMWQPLAGMLAGGVVYGAGLFAGRVLSEADLDLLYRLLAALPGGDKIRRIWQRDTVINW
jgi:O-antigen/teichoic acid export membrane protein